MRFFLGILLLILCGLQCEARSRALLIGVSDYPAESGWRPISASEDLKIISSSLPSNFIIESLLNKEATKLGIEEALRRFASVTEGGDTILVHFSTHGQQMLTEDASEEDLLDEAIIPYDAKLSESVSYHGQSHLRDDLLGKLITSIANNAGKNGLVLVTIDACHSGDLNRGEDKNVVFRGVDEVFGAENLSDNEKDELRSHHYISSNNEISTEEGCAKVVYFSACRARERNRQVEINGVQTGSLSIALARTLQKQPISDTKGFLDCLCSEMGNLRIPQSPDIKTNFGYKQPQNEFPEIMDIEADEAKTSYLLPLVITSGVILVVILICLFLWKRKKRKDCRESY